MARKSKKDKKDKKDKEIKKSQDDKPEELANKPEKLSNKEFNKELERLQGELVKLQYWVKEKGLRIIVVFEGRDAAGKGGIIKRITERVSPRIFRVVALPTPSEREKTQMYTWSILALLFTARDLRQLPIGYLATGEAEWPVHGSRQFRSS